MSKVDADRQPVSEEIEAIREEQLWKIVNHEAGSEYEELHQGNQSDEYHPVAVFGVFPYLSTGGRITLDMMDFTSSEATDTEEGYWSRIMNLPPMDHEAHFDAESAPVLSFQLSMRMRELAVGNKASAVAVFSRDSVRLFYAVGLAPAEALSQLKTTSEPITTGQQS